MDSRAITTTDTYSKLVDFFKADIIVKDGEVLPSYKKTDKAQELIYCQDYYYKIYHEYRTLGYMQNKIRKALGKIYSSYGMKYQVETRDFEDTIFTFEKKQKIPVYGIDIIKTNEEIYHEFLKTLEYVERILGFDRIVDSLQKKGYAISKLKLMLSSMPKPVDFGEFNNKVILLDDENFKIVALDSTGEIILNNVFLEKILVNEEFLTIGTDKVFDKNPTQASQNSYYLSLYDVSKSTNTSPVLLIKDRELKSVQERLRLRSEPGNKLEIFDTHYETIRLDQKVLNKDMLRLTEVKDK